ncbi:MAG TPA: hypothetical protein VG222_19035 [Vicinamibacterales bacterium]|nr:hypothetical protein [Vicinamibacterales bacterium]
MQCRNCSAEIADKALICYRCGAPTTEAKFKPPVPRRAVSRASLVATVLALVLLVLAAIFLGRAPSGETPRAVTWAVVAIAVVIVVLRAYARRRR